MNVSKDELKLLNEWDAVRDAFVKAKRKKDYKDDAEYQKAAVLMDQMRSYWRGIGEYVGHRNPVAPIRKAG